MNDSTTKAIEGYDSMSDKSPYLFSSNSSDAWVIGRWMHQTGRSAPRDVRKSRGYTWHVNDMKVKIIYTGGHTYVQREN